MVQLFEIPCILFRSSYMGKHRSKTTLTEVNLKSKQIQKFKFLLYLEAFFCKWCKTDLLLWTVRLNVRVQDGTEEANDVTTQDEKMTLNEDAKKNYEYVEDS